MISCFHKFSQIESAFNVSGVSSNKLFIGHIWINNLFEAYSTNAYHDKRLCISLHKHFFIEKDKMKLVLNVS